MRVLCEMAKIEGIRIKLNASEAFEVHPMMNLLEMEIENLQGERLGKVSELVYARWNEGGYPVEPGRHDGLKVVDEPVRFFITGKWVEGELLASLDVIRSRYLGELTEAQVAMLKGEDVEADPPDFSQGWRELDADEVFEVEFTIEGVESY